MAAWPKMPARGEKTLARAYLLWLVAGWAGAHRFYLGWRRSGRLMAGLFLLGLAWLLFGIGLLVLAALLVWMVADLFLIPSMLARASDNGPAGGGPDM